MPDVRLPAGRVLGLLVPVVALLLLLVAAVPAGAAPSEHPSWVPFTGSHRISRAFNHPGGHLPNPGIDFAMPVGTPVRAAGNGTVIYSDSMCGNTVAIHHRDAGRTSRYLHLSRRDVRVGDQVSRGEVIGLSGSQGCGSTGPHLHYDEVAGNNWGGSGRISPGAMLGTVDGATRRYPEVFGDRGWAGADEQWVTHDGRAVEAAGSNTVQVTACASDRSSTHTFKDVRAQHPLCADIAWMADEGITTGYAGHQFRPSEDVSRRVVAPFLARSRSADVDACRRAPFLDIRVTGLFCGEITWTSDAGVAGGFADGTYRPARPVTRAQLAAMAARLVGGPQPAACDRRPFTDVPARHPLCAEIAAMAEAGIVTGRADGTFGPDATVARQETAALLARLDRR